MTHKLIDAALAAADALQRRAVVEARIAQMLAGDGAQTMWFRQCLGLEAVGSR